MCIRDSTPVEAGLSFAVAWDKEANFRGRAAIEAQRERGASQRLVQVKLVQPVDENAMPADDAALLHHHEPLWRDGERVGYVTGGMWGHTVGAAIGMALAVRSDGTKLTKTWVDEGTWTIEIPGQMMPAQVQIGPLSLIHI